MRAIVNIRGCNGAGKSTIAMSMMNDPLMNVVYLGMTAHTKMPTSPAFTIFPSYGWIALGTYFNKTGGLDTMSNNDETYSTLMHVLKKYPDYNILFEGVIASTILSTWVKWLNQIKSLYPKDLVMVINFLPPVEVCLSRIQARNGGKPINDDMVRSKWDTVSRNATSFKQAGFKSIKVDTSKYPKEDMLPLFNRIVAKYMEEHNNADNS